MQIKKIADDYGVLADCSRILPKEYYSDLIEAIAELEDNQRYVQRDFPKTRLHKVTGIKWDVYRADIDKISGWRLHVKFCKDDNRIHLCQVVEGQKHDEVNRVIMSQKDRFK
ncbi:TPA: hypothetical protein U1W61_000159 [Streptococcus suis]|nr:hypothetical protein [Streptococcus suis]